MTHWLNSAERVYEGDFTVTYYQEGGPKQSRGKDNVRLVCETREGKTLVFWGTAGEDISNIDKVYKNKLPVKVHCQYREPIEPFASRFGHDWWCPQEAEVKIIG